MATCTVCNLEMLTAEGCAVGTITLDRAVFDRIPHGGSEAWGPATKRCNDCGAAPGKIHHPGCQYEACPKCNAPQMFACDCAKEDGV